MLSVLTKFLLLISFFVIVSCGGKNSKTEEAVADPSLNNNQSTTPINTGADSTLNPVKQLIEKDLGKWAASFPGFTIDSFRMTQTSNFQSEDNEDMADMAQFYELYKPSLSYSPDSSQFIDLYSSGLSLEKRGKKIIAISDVDQAVNLCNLKTKDWKRIAFFGPSAAIEEAIWTSSSTFILAGTMHNDDGQRIAIMMLGDTGSKTFRWFEAMNTKRPESSNYEASGLKKLKIDEWE